MSKRLKTHLPISLSMSDNYTPQQILAESRRFRMFSEGLDETVGRDQMIEVMDGVQMINWYYLIQTLERKFPVSSREVSEIRRNCSRSINAISNALKNRGYKWTRSDKVMELEQKYHELEEHSVA